MRKTFLQILIFILLALLFSCNKDVKETIIPVQPVPMGRFMETPLPAPEGLTGVIADIRMFDDGSVWLIGTGKEKCMIYKSADFGESWEKIDCPWSESLPGDIKSARIVSPQEIYLTVMINKKVRSDSTIESEDYFYRADQNQITPLDISAIKAFSNQYDVRYIDISDSGDLLIRSYDGIAQMDGFSSDIKNMYPMDTFALFGSYITSGDKLIETENGKIYTYSLKNGALMSTADAGTPVINYLGTNYTSCQITALAIDPGDSESIFYANRYGLFRTFLDGSANEMLMDGGLSSLNLHTNAIRFLLAREDGSFLAVCNNAGVNLFYRFSYCANIPTVPSRQIRVFSLYENYTARLAATQLQTKNPDIKISLQIGSPPGSGISAAEALRALSMDMLSGNGPDVFVLDGLPIESYIKNGYLLELSPILRDITATGDYMPQMETYRTPEGEMYAVTTRFSPINMVIKDGESVTDMKSLVEYLNKQQTFGIGCHPSRMMEKYYACLSPGWFPDEKTFDAEKFRSDLNCFAEIIAKQEAFDPVTERFTREANNVGNASMGVAFGTYPAAQVTAYNWYRISNSQYFQDNGLIDKLRPFPAQGVYKPSNTLGISPLARDAELAREFVLYNLSPEVQQMLLNDGFGVHRPSLESSAKSSFPNGVITEKWEEQIYDAKSREYKAVSVNWSWISAERAKSYIDEWSKLKVHEYDDAVVREMIIAETKAFFAGKKSVDATVASIEKKIRACTQ